MSGLFLIAAGVFHVPIWLVDGGPWEGQVSWRKPILFGISTGMTLWSLGWLVSKLKCKHADFVLAWTVGTALVIEVGLITLQQWRGRPSHFNRETTFEAGVDIAMLVLITIAFVGITYFTLRSFGHVEMDADYLWAVRSGMLFLVISCLIGFAISIYGYSRTEMGLPPERMGASGVVKFPHGIAIHALQLFPALVFLFRKFKMESNHRMMLICSASCSMFLMLVYAIYQTTNGLSRFEVGSYVSVLILLAAALVTAVPFSYVIGKRWAALTSQRTG